MGLGACPESEQAEPDQKQCARLCDQADRKTLRGTSAKNGVRKLPASPHAKITVTQKRRPS
jgi:hypothetical protein